MEAFKTAVKNRRSGALTDTVTFQWKICKSWMGVRCPGFTTTVGNFAGSENRDSVASQTNAERRDSQSGLCPQFAVQKISSVKTGRLAPLSTLPWTGLV